MRTIRPVLRSVSALAVMMLLGQMTVLAEGTTLMTSGKIAMVDPQQHMVRLKTGVFVTKVFVVERDTKITSGQRQLMLNDLEPGADATIEYVQQGDRQVARAITLAPSEPGATPASQEAAPQPGARQ